MKYNNLKYIKKQSIRVYDLLKKLKDPVNSTFGLDRSGSDLNIYFHGKSRVYLSSVEHKKVEANLLTHEVYKGEFDEIIVFGVGSIEFLRTLLDNKPRYSRVHIIEYDEVMSLLLNKFDLRKIKFDKIDSMTLLHDEANIGVPLLTMFKKSTMKFKFFVLPQYERLFTKDVDKFRGQFKEVLDDKRGSIRVNKAYEKLWIINSIINFKHVISTPNFFDIRKTDTDFSNSAVIIVGAGPSLNHDMELLRKISKIKKCYVVAIGSSYRTLIKNDVNMDVIFSYDPTTMNVEVLNDYHNNELDTLLCFGSSISFEAIRGVKYENAAHVLISQDYFSSYLLQDSKTQAIIDAPSVANIALMAVLGLGFRTIYFAGMDMSYSGNTVYADGIDSERIKKRKKSPNKIYIKNVFGEDVETTKGLSSAKNGIEAVVNRYKNCTFINTTYGGASIEGAEYKELSRIDFSGYDDKVTFKELLSPNKYDIQKSGERFKELNEERIQFVAMLNKGFYLLYQLKEDLDLEKQIEVTRVRDFEKLYNDFLSNKYYSVIISKLDRIYVNFFQNSVVEINRETNLHDKFLLLYKRMGTILSLFKQSDQMVYKLFKYISKWIEWE